MNGSRGMMSLVRRHCACKDVFQSSKSQQPSSKEPETFIKPSATGAILELEVSLDVVSLEFMKSFWLVKQEPSSYSWSDFVAEGQTSWTGVRNYTARNNLRKMRVGDEVLFYHSGEEKAVVGIAKVMRTAYPDPTAKEGDWSTLDLAPIKPLRRPVALRDIKSNLQLKRIPLVRQSRLSVMPLDERAFREIVRMAAT
jgi:predicted RNA-binding protein with PUA-like domain